MAETHAGEPDLHQGSLSSRLNWLRAGVLGANDGIVSVAALVVGVAGANAGRGTLLTVGAAGLVAGALSMAAGEYVSVSTQRDTQRALLDKERRELHELPEEELAELAAIYVEKGLSEPLARQVAQELTAHDALAAHADAELGIDPEEVVSPWQAAWASAAAFTLGALIPVLAIVLVPHAVAVVACFLAVLVALALTGAVGARLGGAPLPPAVLRTVLGGAVAMVATYGIGRVFGTGV
ncbi:VIT family protein [Kineococcus gynurae]|uniref:VIT family protein n=1 Tax=Kineococcus gynurae TaxID=452979 RepID=A0ABV5LU80_9ACTN